MYSFNSTKMSFLWSEHSVFVLFIVLGIKNFLMREIAEMVKKTNQKKLLSNTMYTYKYRKIVTQFENISFLPIFYSKTHVTSLYSIWRLCNFTLISRYMVFSHKSHLLLWLAFHMKFLCNDKYSNVFSFLQEKRVFWKQWVRYSRMRYLPHSNVYRNNMGWLLHEE